MFRLGRAPSRPLDQLRPGLLQIILQRIRALNANTRLLLQLLEDPDWSDIRSRAIKAIRSRTSR